MIQSINNKKIKEYAKLIQKKERDKTNLFLVEGEHMVKEAYNARMNLEQVHEDETTEPVLSM